MPCRDVLDPNPFAKSSVAKEGSSSAAQIYTDVGFALDRYEHLGTTFGVLYSAFVKPEGSNHTMMRSFGMITSSNNRREMIVAASESYFSVFNNEVLERRTRSLLKLFSDASARRNEIAHAMVMGEMRHRIVDQVAMPMPTAWFLVPPLFATRKQELHMRGPKYRYSSREIGYLTKCFEALDEAALDLVRLIREFHSSLPDQDRQAYA